MSPAVSEFEGLKSTPWPDGDLEDYRLDGSDDEDASHKLSRGPSGTTVGFRSRPGSRRPSNLETPRTPLSAKVTRALALEQAVKLLTKAVLEQETQDKSKAGASDEASDTLKSMLQQIEESLKQFGGETKGTDETSEALPRPSLQSEEPMDSFESNVAVRKSV